MSPEAVLRTGANDPAKNADVDPAGVVQAWEELLRQKQQIEEFIAKAKQHAKG
jgi:hypothetical protein